MQKGCVSIDRIISRLDEYLHRNDYASAERHLKYWIEESEKSGDTSALISLLNELMGLFRKLGREDEALECTKKALSVIDANDIKEQVGAATTFLNCGTVYKAFDRAADSIELFSRAEAIYLKELDENDRRLAGLYNNMSLALVDIGEFSRAEKGYEVALKVLAANDDTEAERAITYLNMASLAEARCGIIDADEEIQGYLDKAEILLDSYEKNDGAYAFVCEKCAHVFGYYGRFAYEKELFSRARRIYEGD